jgi:exopolysaccharide biosynthesis polyprenyl glycosylphosphotransferase
MKKGRTLKTITLFLGDIVVLYAALFAALLIRYGNSFYRQFIDVHFVPFTVIFVPWLIIFYIAGLYDLRRLRNGLDFMKTLALTLLVNAIVAMFFFYFIPAFGIAPKTNLFIFIICFAVIEVIWRRISNTLFASGEAPNRMVLVGDGNSADEIARAVTDNPQMGYLIVKRISEKDVYGHPSLLEDAVKETGANLLVVPRHFKYQTDLAMTLYSFFGKGILIVDVVALYEHILQKVPLADIEETWFIDNIEGVGRYYDSLKRAAEFLFALIFGIILLPIELIVALLVKTSSPGPAIYKQIRVGQNGKPFTLYKFRTMRQADKNEWLDADKSRITGVGKVLRSTHLDELPQFINLLCGDISLVGPRPDYIEFYNKLKDIIPYYSIRTIIKPGITGWAQVAFPVTESIEQTKERLCYDVYYLKNRSLIFDSLIILKTLKTVVIAAGE